MAKIFGRLAINKYLWNAQKGMYFDYDFMAGKQSTYDYLTTFYPLWAGAADAQQAKAVEANLKVFEKAGGTAMSPYETGVQWDLPYGWAPVTWLTVDGLAKSGDTNDAVRISQNSGRWSSRTMNAIAPSAKNMTL